MKHDEAYVWGLNLLRFTMSIVIVIYHYQIVFSGAAPGREYPVLAYFYSGYGQHCVEIFFAISGFVLYRNHSKKLRLPPPRGVAFILGRVIRIYPLMILTTVCTSVCLWLTIALFPEGRLVSAGWATDSQHTSLIAFVMSICGMQSGWVSHGDYFAVSGTSWYLSVLMICYLIFYLVLKLCKGDQVKENCCFILLILLGIHLQIQDEIHFPLMYRSCGRGYMNVFLGALTAQVVEAIDTEKKRIYTIGISLAGIFLYYLLFNLNCLGNAYVATSLVMSPALLLLYTNSNLITRISNNRFVTYLGNISFGIYLWHLPIVSWLYFFQDFFGLDIDYGSQYMLLGIIAASIITATATYKLYERPTAVWCRAKLKPYLEKF